MKSCVTISLVEEARGGPFVYWDDLPAACRSAKALGFDAIEIFPPEAEAIDAPALEKLLDENDLKLAAVGTGAGWVKRRLHLCLPNEADRKRAKAFIRSIIDAAGQFGASAIIGSMQGRSGEEVDRAAALDYLGEALAELGRYAAQRDAPLIYEPLNRYETNLVNTVEEGVRLLDRHGCENVVLLADLFHMNIEEADLPAALRAGKGRIGHVHFVDPNRRAAGMGHMQYEPILAALREIGYDGYLSAEALSLPDSEAAARRTIEAFKKYAK
jgi:sugar phosphate isomerase/epimerase